MSTLSSTITRPFCRVASADGSGAFAAPSHGHRRSAPEGAAGARVRGVRSADRRRGATSGEGDRVLPAAVPPDPRERRVVGQGVHRVDQRRRAACPRFRGHYQPRLPRDLGFYDLRERRRLRRQVELARAAGIHGFVFLLLLVRRQAAAGAAARAVPRRRAIDFPFCLRWANENWTRRWDGHDDEMLISQEYDPGYDVGAHRRPAAALSRPALHPHRRPAAAHGLPRRPASRTPRDRIARWRELWRSRHDEEPLIFVAQAFGSADPHAFGLDGAFEFPPHKLVEGLPAINSQLTILDSTLPRPCRRV